MKGTATFPAGGILCAKSGLVTDFGAPISGAPPAGDSFDGNRWNDLHYTSAAKEATRTRHVGAQS